MKWKRDEYTSGDDKCSDFYEGPFPKSEPEVKLLSGFLQKNNKHIKLFVNLDGYGQGLISFPGSSLKRKSLDDIQDIARSGLKNLKTHRGGMKYSIKKVNFRVGAPKWSVETFFLFLKKISTLGN